MRARPSPPTPLELKFKAVLSNTNRCSGGLCSPPSACRVGTAVLVAAVNRHSSPRIGPRAVCGDGCALRHAASASAAALRPPVGPPPYPSADSDILLGTRGCARRRALFGQARARQVRCQGICLSCALLPWVCCSRVVRAKCPCVFVSCVGGAALYVYLGGWGWLVTLVALKR